MPLPYLLLFSLLRYTIDGPKAVYMELYFSSADSKLEAEVNARSSRVFARSGIGRDRHGDRVDHGLSTSNDPHVFLILVELCH